MRPAVLATLVLVTSLLAVTGAQDGRQESLSSARRLLSVAAENAGGQTRKDVDNTGGSDEDDEGDGSVNDDGDGKSGIEDKAGASEVDLAEGLRDSNSSSARVAGSKKSGSRQNYLPANPPMDAETIISKGFTCNRKRLPLYDWCKKCVCWDNSWYCTAEWCYDWPNVTPDEPEDTTSYTGRPQDENYPESEPTTTTPEPEYSAPVADISTPEPGRTTTETEPQPVTTRPLRPTWQFPPIPFPPQLAGIIKPRPPNRRGRLGVNRTPGSHRQPSRRPWPPRRPRQSSYPQPSRRIRPVTNKLKKKIGSMLRDKKQ